MGFLITPEEVGVFVCLWLTLPREDIFYKHSIFGAKKIRRVCVCVCVCVCTEWCEGVTVAPLTASDHTSMYFTTVDRPSLIHVHGLPLYE